ncbi:hypothetical protein EOD42_21050 [Rhodovarius crocodyli]|uniref:Transporter n=1 Tax=Rhodovarius crocodyli TaxID=1979269 RepID=A0A437M2J8_9PROT|nr:hypothetical protein [Rhodovarius crocodyli]RVT91806.1 hypothetical protein EOD42_21050 [Rhodovarius crocodyli]
MSQAVTLTAAHWMYLLGVAAIIVTMIFRANVVVPSILATFLVGLAWTGSGIGAVSSVFNASFVAAKELFNIFLVIALMTALLNSLKVLEADILMVRPFKAVMKDGRSGFLVLALVTYLISLFFWPTPAIPLVSAVLLPAAIAAGLPPLASAAVIAIAGQGMALSSDYVIGVAPGISARAAGAAVQAATVADRALVLSLVTGLIALALTYWKIRGTIMPPSSLHLVRWQARASNDAELHAIEEQGSFDKAELARGTLHEEPEPVTVGSAGRLFAILTPIVFGIVVALMVLPRLGLPLPTLRGGDAAALIGGAAALLMLGATLAKCGARQMLETSADHVTDGFVFAFRAMGSVLPIAGFFFLGAGETAASVFGGSAASTPSLLFDLVRAAESWIPHNHILVGFGVLIVGMVTGIDGSGFSGLPLTGALSGALGAQVGLDPATLAAIGQMGAVWTGGGTLIAWSSLIAVAGFARVPVLKLVQLMMLPVLAGLAVSTVLAVLIW